MFSRYVRDRVGPIKRGQVAYPPPVRPPSATLQSSEAIAAGDLVNIYTSGGQTRARKANASDMSKPANAFAPKAVGNGEAGLFHFVGQIISDLSGLTPGTSYYLDTTGGGLTATPPSIEGQGVQLVGVALSATSFLFSPQPMVEFN